MGTKNLLKAPFSRAAIRLDATAVPPSRKTGYAAISLASAGEAVRAASTPASRKTVSAAASSSAGRSARFAARAFKAWFERNFVNMRAGMIGLRPYARAGALDDSLSIAGAFGEVPPGARGARGGARRARRLWYSEAYERAVADYVEPMGYVEEAFLREHPLVAVQMMFGMTDVRGLRCYMRGLSNEIARMQRRAYRTRYYARDNARRRELAAERRKIRRRATLNACPSPDEFREAFARARSSKEARVRFGSMVEDLSCHVDSALRFDADGNVVGRNGGVRAWIAENLPELSPKYKTIMRYKALAMRLKQAAGLRDPEPADRVLEEAPSATAQQSGESPAARRERVRDVRLERVRALLAGAKNTWDALFDAADRAIAEDESPGSG